MVKIFELNTTRVKILNIKFKYLVINIIILFLINYNSYLILSKKKTFVVISGNFFLVFENLNLQLI